MRKIRNILIISAAISLYYSPHNGWALACIITGSVAALLEEFDEWDE